MIRLMLEKGYERLQGGGKTTVGSRRGALGVSGWQWREAGPLGVLWEVAAVELRKER